ncbi:DNA transposase THAP9 [Dissostichus eleginoides]|uniref:DNA transposase THAP9 n=1 Tax=Dissostichus eleginoides TaxID=100907 RepID=A0AAD9F320_DISEL|nr:DNA transposase THAP9 [Dissostichus eleginoides]
MGDGNNETDVATEALVFMVVGLQGHWKAPIAYYLTKSLSPETQRVLLSHALEELHARGIGWYLSRWMGMPPTSACATNLGVS